MKRNKKVVVIICFIILIIIFLLCFIFGIKYNKYLKSFEILEIKMQDGDTYYHFEDTKAIRYDVIFIYDNYEITKTVIDNEGIIPINFNYNTDLKVKVIAYGENKETKESRNTYTYRWIYPSFNKKNNVYLNQEQEIMVDGNIGTKEYNLIFKYEGESIINISLNGFVPIFPYNEVKNIKGKIIGYIYDNDKVVAKKNFYLNFNNISQVSILSPFNEINYEDFNFKFEGGANSDKIVLNIYENSLLFKSIVLKERNIKLEIKDFKEETEYLFELIASYKDYNDLTVVDKKVIKVLPKPSVKEVYTNKDFYTLKKGSKLNLYSRTEEATIYYTLDGSDPNNGFVYKEPLDIKGNTLVKAIAKKVNMKDSNITSFEIKLEDKIPIVYLSPSNQISNLGVSEVGYSNERYMMNKVGTVVYNKLKEAGIKVYRNNPDQNMAYWIGESNYVNSDLHLAIHSNGSVNHDKQGVEVYVHEETSPAYSIALMLYDAIYDLYSYKSEETNKGVLYAEGAMGEVNPLNVKMGVLLEIAYHDDINDARWIVNNINEIGESIANAIIKYFEV